MNAKRHTTLAALIAAALASPLPTLAEEPPPELDAPPPRNVLWNLDLIDWQAASDAGFDGSGVIVGILDDAVDIEHPEYAARLAGSLDLFTGGPIDYFPPDPHGTHVAGTAVGSNVGVARGATLHALNIFDYFDSGVDFFFESNVLLPLGIDWMLQRGAQVINNSWGIPGLEISDPDLDAETLEFLLGPLIDAYRRTAEAGVVMVWGNGNDGFDDAGPKSGLPFLFPELQATWLAVAAVGPDGNLPEYSNACGVAASWCLAAPGGGIGDHDGVWSSIPGGRYAAYDFDDEGPWSGTSMAAPHVTGAVAIGMQMFPQAASEQIVQLVLRTAIDIGAAGVDPIYGWGLLNVGNLVDTVNPIGASLFATSAWSRFEAIGHAGTVLRQQLHAAGAMQGHARQPAGPGFWTAPVYGRASVDATAASRHAVSRTAGFMVGSDLIARESFRLGVAGGFTRSRLGVRGVADEGEAEGIHLGVYAQQNLRSGWTQETSLQTVFLKQELERHAIPGTQGTVLSPVGISDFRAQGFEFDYRAARTLRQTAASATQFYISTNWRYQTTRSFAEQDADIFSVNARRTSLDRGDVAVGVRWTSPRITDSIGAMYDIAYLRQLDDRDHATTVSLLDRDIVGRTADVGRDGMRVSAQLTLNTDNRLAAFIGYEGVFPRRTTSHTITAGLRRRF